MNTLRNSNSFDLDLARLSVGPDLAHNCWQKQTIKAATSSQRVNI